MFPVDRPLVKSVHTHMIDWEKNQYNSNVFLSAFHFQNVWFMVCIKAQTSLYVQVLRVCEGNNCSYGHQYLWQDIKWSWLCICTSTLKWFMLHEHNEITCNGGAIQTQYYGFRRLSYGQWDHIITLEIFQDDYMMFATFTASKYVSPKINM